MIKNFLKVALRNIRKQGFYALFNSLGIAMAIACSIIIYLIIAVSLYFWVRHGEDRTTSNAKN